MEHLIIRRKSTGTNLYKATAERNLSVYPRTQAGDLAYLQACSTGQIAMTAENGCAIPTGARPPITMPTCGTTGSGDGPSWASSWYDYNGTLLSIRATGDDMLLKFERSDGQPLALKNPDDIDIDNLTFYEHATLAGNVYQWQVNFPSAPSLKITYKRKSDSATYTKTFTPTVGASNVNLFNAGQAAGCNFSVAVNSVNASCGQSITLTATVSGADASGVSVSWSNGMTGNSITFNAPGFNGSYAYTATASKSGCTSKTADATVVVTGCTDVQPLNGFPYTAPTTQTAWMGHSDQQIGFVKISNGYPVNITIGDYDYLENQHLRVEIRRGLGCLVQVIDKVTGRVLINSPDLGRGDGPSSYTEQDWTYNKNYVDQNGNHPFAYDGKNPAPGPWFTGRNPLKDGDWAGHPSTLLFHGKITIEGVEYLYYKTQLNSWSHANNSMLPMYLEQWVSLQGKVIRQYNKLSHNYTQDLTDYGPYKQEWRLMMVNGWMKEAVYYNGHQPYTNAGVTRSNGIERGTAETGFVTPGPAFGVSEPWIGVTIDQNNPNRVIAHYAPDMYWPSYNAMDQHEGGDGDGARTGMYTSGHVMANLDALGTWYFQDDWIVGDINTDVRAYVYAQQRAGAPDWHFNSATQRNGWHGFNGVNDPQLPVASNDTRGWMTVWNGKADGGPANIDNTYIASPRTAFKGSTCPTLYIKVKLSNTTQTQYKVKWTYVGQEREPLNGDTPNENARRFPLGTRPDSQVVNFSMNNDGNVHVYAIPMTWDADKYINNVEIWANGSGLQTKPNMDILYIGYQNPS